MSEILTDAIFALGVLFAGTLTQFFAAKFFHDAA